MLANAILLGAGLLVATCVYNIAFRPSSPSHERSWIVGTLGGLIIATAVLVVQRGAL